MKRREDGLVCGSVKRRKKLFGNADWNGIDYVEISDDQRSLCVHFFGPVPDGVSVENVVITGGHRIRGIQAVEVKVERAKDPELDDCLNIAVDRPGDFSIYRLCLVEAQREILPAAESELGRESEVTPIRARYAGAPPQGRPLRGIDPRYACVDFTFKIGCASKLDCRLETDCSAPDLVAPEINYLAKDYSTFRQLVLDRLAALLPEWTERHVPDIGITLVELLAYVADYLSYYQDAVATESYLDTARKRISVRRHGLLVDYHLHEGCNGRAWVTVWTATDIEPLLPGAFYFITGFPGIAAGNGRVLNEADLEFVPPSTYESFEPLVADQTRGIEFRAHHSEIHLYTWGDDECCLEVGATQATLLDEAEVHEADKKEPKSSKQRALHLEPGDVLVFEEVKGPTTGNRVDADPTHRHAVRLTGVKQNEDQLLGRLVLEVEWAHPDALPFSLCLSARMPPPDCSRIEDVSVARANVVLVEHGRRVTEQLGPVEVLEVVGDCSCEGSIVDEFLIPKTFSPALAKGPVSFAQRLRPGTPASRSLTQDPHDALPEISLMDYTEEDGEVATSLVWRPTLDLTLASSEDRAFVVEIDDEGAAHLRFGDGELGRQPQSGTRFSAQYRVGNGPAGNTGRDTINYLVLRAQSLSGDLILPRNPLAATGGVGPEPIAEAKLLAPTAFRIRKERAVTGDDYAELAQRDPRLQRAAAELRWTGSWYEAHVAVDPSHSESASRWLLDAVEDSLHRYRRIGHDVSAVGAIYVPLALTMQVCLLSSAARAAVAAELIAAFSNRRLSSGRLGFFHPDHLTFGDGVRVSQLIAAAKAVEGVETAKVTRLQRLDGPDVGAPATGVLPLAAMEIAQLDNDPSFPEHGVFKLELSGGR